MEKVYDQFPINLLEMQGPVNRQPIEFMTDSVKIYSNGICILDKKIKVLVKGNIVDKEMYIEIHEIDLDKYLDKYIESRLRFSEISLNGDRILWSNNLLEGGYSSSATIPAFLSLFFQSGNLKRLQFSNQNYAIEFEGNNSENKNLNSSKVADMTKIETFAQKAINHMENKQEERANICLFYIYDEVLKNPSCLQRVTDYSIIGKAFLFMILNCLFDDIDKLQGVSSLSYLFLSEAIKNKQDNNLDLYQSRLLVLNAAHDYFKYTVMAVLAQEECTDGFASLMFQSRADIKSRDAILKMEFADMDKCPTICSSVPYFSERRRSMLDRIDQQFFLSAKSAEEVVKQGDVLHKQVYQYLRNKILVDCDIDF